MKLQQTLPVILMITLSHLSYSQQQQQQGQPSSQSVEGDPIRVRAKTSDIAGLCTDLKEAPYVSMGNSRKEDCLISNYAFRKLIRKNFGSLILGNDNISKIGRFATLDVSDDNSFSFSPYTLESNPKKTNYINIFSLNFAGQLNDKKIFKLADYRDLSASISYVRILKWSNYTTTPRPDETFKEKYRDCILKAPLNELCEKYEKKLKETPCLTHEEEQQKKQSIYNGFVDEYTDLETNLTDQFWDKKKFWWLNIDLKFFGRDEFSYLYKPLLDANNYTPTKKAVYTPGITVGLNHFIHYNQNGNSFLFSIWGALNRKHSLSDIFQPDDFQPYHSVYDSLIQLKSLESVYITDFEDITTKWAVDLGIRSVQMFDISSETRKRQLGISLSFVRNGLVNQGKFPSLFRTETGIVIPFLTNDGESTFNLEVFKRWDTFSNFPAANESFWGLRFNVPISSK